MLGLQHTKSSTKDWVVAINKQQKMLLSSQKQTFDPRNVIFPVNGVKFPVPMAEKTEPSQLEKHLASNAKYKA